MCSFDFGNSTAGRGYWIISNGNQVHYYIRVLLGFLHGMLQVLWGLPYSRQVRTDWTCIFDASAPVDCPESVARTFWSHLATRAHEVRHRLRSLFIAYAATINPHFPCVNFINLNEETKGHIAVIMCDVCLVACVVESTLRFIPSWNQHAAALHVQVCVLMIIITFFVGLQMDMCSFDAQRSTVSNGNVCLCWQLALCTIRITTFHFHFSPRESARSWYFSIRSFHCAFSPRQLRQLVRLMWVICTTFYCENYTFHLLRIRSQAITMTMTSKSIIIITSPSFYHHYYHQ